MAIRAGESPLQTVSASTHTDRISHSPRRINLYLRAVAIPNVDADGLYAAIFIRLPDILFDSPSLGEAFRSRGAEKIVEDDLAGKFRVGQCASAITREAKVRSLFLNVEYL